MQKHISTPPLYLREDIYSLDFRFSKDHIARFFHVDITWKRRGCVTARVYRGRHIRTHAGTAKGYKWEGITKLRLVTNCSGHRQCVGGKMRWISDLSTRYQRDCVPECCFIAGIYIYERHSAQPHNCCRCGDVLLDRRVPQHLFAHLAYRACDHLKHEHIGPERSLGFSVCVRGKHVYACCGRDQDDAYLSRQDAARVSHPARVQCVVA